MQNLNKLYFIISFFVLIFSVNTYSQVCVGDSAILKWKYWDGFYESSFEELSIQNRYPDNPVQTKNIYRLSLPYNYNNLFGAEVEGFIKVDSTHDVTFNVTGNENVHFLLSPDSNPDNAVLVAEVIRATGTEEHDKDPEQTSQSITLYAGTYHYFKLKMFENYSADHATVWWKTELVDQNNWNIITANYLWGVACEITPCQDLGTPCDDGDSGTTNDIYDGNCNCYGTPVTTNSCVGLQGDILAYRFDTIPGSDINYLYEAPNYPTMPTNGVKLNDLVLPSRNLYNEIGYLVQGYLTVPVTGNYKFNVTGDDNTIFFLSSDELPENKQDNFCLVYGYTYFNQYDKYITQSTGNVNLEAGKYYYFEINQKEGGGSEHFAVQWQTPYTPPNVWKRIPSIFVYDYLCELACIQEGTPCDDGNLLTNNDMFDANCDCVGTPCSGADCDSPLISYIPNEPCAETELIDNNPENNWLSCAKDENPNTLRDSSHWIMYDLGGRYELINSNIWNYNVPGETDNGFEAVAVDISEDGVNWTEFGTYNWPLATGESPYGGFPGPYFNGTTAKYVLVTSLDMDNTCRGISKITFTAVECPLAGTVCDDNDDDTILDHYDTNCECKGVPLDANLCSEVYLNLGDSILSTNNYSAEQYVSSVSQINSNSKVSLIGGNYVELNPGFETQANSLFLAAIAECLELPLESTAGELKNAINKKKKEQLEKDKIAGLQVIQPDKSGDFMVKFYIEKPTEVNLALFDKNDKLIATLANSKFRNAGVYKKRVRVKKLNGDSYKIKLTTKEKTLVEPLVILK